MEGIQFFIIFPNYCAKPWVTRSCDHTKTHTEHAQDTGSVYWACPVCQTPALSNYTKCLNIVRTSSKTLYCTLQGHTHRYTITTYFRITNTFTDCRLLETHCPDFWTLFIIEGYFLQSLLLNKHYFKTNTTVLLSL